MHLEVHILLEHMEHMSHVRSKNNNQNGGLLQTAKLSLRRFVLVREYVCAEFPLLRVFR